MSKPIEKSSVSTLDIFIKTAQFLSSLSSIENFWPEVHQIFKKFYHAHFFSFFQFDDPSSDTPSFTYTCDCNSLEINNLIIDQTYPLIKQVVNDGFLFSNLISIPEKFAVTGLAISEANQIIGVMVIAHKRKDKIEKEILNIYLAIAGLIGTRRERLLALEQLRQYNIKLEEEVAQRTKELVNINKELEILVGTIPDGILVIQPDGQIRLTNDTCDQITSRLLGTPISSGMNLLELSDDNPFNNALKKIFQKIQSNQEDTNLKIEADRDYWLEFFWATLRQPESDVPIATIIEIRDISQFIEFDNTRKQFVSMVSHELRTPISTIALSINNYQKYKDKLTPEQRDKIFDIIDLNSKNLSQLVEDLLVIARIEEQRIKIRWEKFTVLPMINQIIEQMMPKGQIRNIEFKVEIDPEIFLYGDDSRLAQAFRVFIDNAIKYSNIDSTIEIRAIDNYCGEYNPQLIEGVLIQVEDHGIGIKKKDLNHIFERFYRSDDVKHIPGTGLGLDIAMQFIQMHQGMIYIQSEFGKGSVFSVFLPRLEEKPGIETRIGKMIITKCD